MKPIQLELFEPSILVQRGTYGQSLYELADWTLTHGAFRLRGSERGFLYGILSRQRPISLDDAAEIHRLYHRVGKRQESGR
jgi:hypothetical protein